MPDELIIRHCSPTLAGLKTGNMFSVVFDCKERMVNDLKSINAKLRDKGLRAVSISKGGSRYLIYIFRPDRLAKDLATPKASIILKEKGYHTGDCSRCLAQLIKRIKSDENFPHEIGLFLGYPPDDVIGFIDGKKPAKACGHWKVYSNLEDAEKQFSKFRRCTNAYCAEIKKGKTLEQLIVPAKSK